MTNGKLLELIIIYNFEMETGVKKKIKKRINSVRMSIFCKSVPIELNNLNRKL